MMLTVSPPYVLLFDWRAAVLFVSQFPPAGAIKANHTISEFMAEKFLCPNYLI
jgi:hypothetical protein